MWMEDPVSMFKSLMIEVQRRDGALVAPGTLLVVMLLSFLFLLLLLLHPPPSLEASG